MPKTESVPVPEEDLGRLLASAGSAILVGGQALAYWMGRYGIDASDSPEAVVTRDVDFLGEKSDAARLAGAVGGSVEYPKDMSILAGVVRKRITAGKEYEVDVLWKVNGASQTDIRRTAEKGSRDGVDFNVMSPIACLKTRLANLRTILDKQSPAGIWQARTALRVARRYIEEVLEGGNEKAAIRAATDVVAMATHDMGANAWRKYGIDALDAVPVDRFTSRSFLLNQWAKSVARIEKVRDVARKQEAARSGR